MGFLRFSGRPVPRYRVGHASQHAVAVPGGSGDSRACTCRPLSFPDECSRSHHGRPAHNSATQAYFWSIKPPSGLMKCSNRAKPACTEFAQWLRVRNKEILAALSVPPEPSLPPSGEITSGATIGFVITISGLVIFQSDTWCVHPGAEVSSALVSVWQARTPVAAANALGDSINMSTSARSSCSWATLSEVPASTYFHAIAAAGKRTN